MQERLVATSIPVCVALIISAYPWITTLFCCTDKGALVHHILWNLFQEARNNIAMSSVPVRKSCSWSVLPKDIALLSCFLFCHSLLYEILLYEAFLSLLAVEVLSAAAVELQAWNCAAQIHMCSDAVILSNIFETVHVAMYLCSVSELGIPIPAYFCTYNMMFEGWWHVEESGRTPGRLVSDLFSCRFS